MQQYRICSEWWVTERTSVQVFLSFRMLGNRLVGLFSAYVWMNIIFIL